MLILGDANLDANKWNDDKFLHKKVAEELKNSLKSNNLEVCSVGNTYLANHAQKNCNIATSAIDHIYCNESLASKISISKSNNCSSDHIPVIANITSKFKDCINISMIVVLLKGPLGISYKEACM